MDLMFFNYLDKLDDEDPWLIEDILEKMPDNLYQGHLVYANKYDHSMSSPELLPPVNRWKAPRRWFNEKTDMWTLGCIIFNMGTGVPPFYVNDNHIASLHSNIRKADWRTQFRPF